MKKNLRASILFLTIMSIWGIIYPQYTLTENMYQVKKDGKVTAYKDCARDYRNILSAKRGEVEIKFSFLEKIEDLIGEKKTDAYIGK